LFCPSAHFETVPLSAAGAALAGVAVVLFATVPAFTVAAAAFLASGFLHTFLLSHKTSPWHIFPAQQACPSSPHALAGASTCGFLLPPESVASFAATGGLAGGVAFAAFTGCAAWHTLLLHTSPALHELPAQHCFPALPHCASVLENIAVILHALWPVESVTNAYFSYMSLIGQSPLHSSKSYPENGRAVMLTFAPYAPVAKLGYACPYELGCAEV